MEVLNIMRLSSRFILDNLFLLAAAFLVVASMTWSAGLAALWSLVAALAFSGTLLTWLIFADALAVGVLALADLTAHEATTEKVVHQLDVHDGTTAEQRAAA